MKFTLWFNPFVLSIFSNAVRWFSFVANSPISFLLIEMILLEISSFLVILSLSIGTWRANRQPFRVDLREASQRKWALADYTHTQKKNTKTQPQQRQWRKEYKKKGEVTCSSRSSLSRNSRTTWSVCGPNQITLTSRPSCWIWAGRNVM